MATSLFRPVTVDEGVIIPLEWAPVIVAVLVVLAIVLAVVKFGGMELVELAVKLVD